MKKVYLGDGKARKVKKGYAGIGGVARLVYTAEPVTYTGTFSVEDVEFEGRPHKLFALTSSGALELNAPARLWMCGGGYDGVGGMGSDDPKFMGMSGNGGNGGKFLQEESLAQGKYTVSIGSSNGGTTRLIGVVELSTDSSQAINGSGGAGYSLDLTDRTFLPGSGSKGGGVTTRPFAIPNLHPHCAGGGGGMTLDSHGGDGGSDGGDGVTPYSNHESATGSNKGGDYGGGDGGEVMKDGYDATYYGGGGGGAGMGYMNYTEYTNGGKGYQGVVYLLIQA